MSMIGNQTQDSALTAWAAVALQKPAASQHKMTMAFAGHHAFPGIYGWYWEKIVKQLILS